MIKIEMENIGGIRGGYDFTLEKGLNILEAPNATGKTSVINGIRTLILPSDELKKKERRHFLNLMVKDGSVIAKDGSNSYIREIHEAGGILFVSGDTLYGAGLEADILSVAYRDNDLLSRLYEQTSNFTSKSYFISKAKITENFICLQTLYLSFTKNVMFHKEGKGGL